MEKQNNIFSANKKETICISLSIRFHRLTFMSISFQRPYPGSFVYGTFPSSWNVPIKWDFSSFLRESDDFKHTICLNQSPFRWVLCTCVGNRIIVLWFIRTRNVLYNNKLKQTTAKWMLLINKFTFSSWYYNNTYINSNWKECSLARLTHNKYIITP